jgi:hypothetical protein
VSSITEGDLRRSAVEAYGCPFRYQQIHLNNVDDTGDESLRGRAFHAAAWIYVLRLAAKQATADHEEAQLALREGIRTIGCPDPLIAPVTKLWDRFVGRFELDLDAFLQAEEIVKRGRRTFRPDLVYARPGELEIKDWKTYYKGLTETQARAELQPQWYLVEAKQAWPGFARYRFTYVFVRLGYEVSIVFTPEEIDAMEAGVQGSIDAVVEAEAQGIFPALPGSHCTLCRINCPVVDDPARTPIRVTTEAEALDVFGQVLALEQRRKTLVKALGAYVKVEGPLALRGQIYQHVPTDSRRFPMDAVVEQVPDAARQALVTVSATGLKPIWRKLTDMPGALLERAIATRGWRFRHSKAGEVVPDGLVDVLDDEDEGGDDGD